MKASSSLEQQNIEKYKTLNKQEGLDLRPTKLKLDKNTEVWLDGYDERNSAICEIYAHIGKLKGSQPDKIASDFLKMILVQKCKKISLKKNILLCKRRGGEKSHRQILACTHCKRVRYRYCSHPTTKRERKRDFVSPKETKNDKQLSIIYQ